MQKNIQLSRLARTCAASVAGLTLAMTLGAPAHATVDPDIRLKQTAVGPEQKLTASMKDAQGQVAAYVQFSGAGALEATGGPNAHAADPARAKAVEKEVKAKADTVASSSSSEVLYTTHNSLPGAAVQGDAEDIRVLAERPDVVKVSRIVPKTRSNSGTTIDTKTVNTWQNVGVTGKDLRIAVIDSGIDYTHADFGGPGTDEAYDRAKASPTMVEGTYDPKKLVAGYDLAGDDYNGNDPKKVAVPDNNPLDCKLGGHGTHVAGTAAGYGVTAEGKTFTGDYSKLTEQQVRDMKIGPGSAPEAQLIGIRVFGCEGTTMLTGQALDRALDPNGDGDFSDRADIINLSLGADFGAADDPENDIIEKLTDQGILSVIAAGNANNYDGVGDTYNVLGNPPNAMSALTVANSIGSTYLADAAEISGSTIPKNKVISDYSRSFDYAAARPEQLTGEVVAAPADNRFGCQPFDTSFEGKWVLLQWDNPDGTFPCGSKVRFDNVEKAGGKGVVLTTDNYPDQSGIAGNETIPGVRLNKEASEQAREATAGGGSFHVKLSPEWMSSISAPTDSLDVLNTSSARGQHGSYGLTKPDVAAPGTNILSAAVGAGNAGQLMTGTSMAAPHVAGIAALVLQAHPGYAPADIKAAITNTATHDITNAEGIKLAVDRTGTGRVDAAAAVATDVLAYNSDSKKQVSTSFGVLEVPVGSDTKVLTKKITVENKSDRARTFNVALDQSVTMPGVRLSVTPTVTVPANSSAQVTVTATVDPAALDKTADPGLEVQQMDHARQFIAQASGRVKITENGGNELRVPVQIAPKPVGDMKANVARGQLKGKGSSAAVKLRGTELNQGAYRGLMGAFELGARSERLPEDSLTVPSERRIDLQYVGASTSEGMLNFGLTSWGNWDVLTWSAATEIEIDTNKDGRADFFLDIDRVKGLDYPVATLYQPTADGTKVVDVQPINGVFGDVDTNLMDTNAVVVPVTLKALGLEGSTESINYKVKTYSWYSDGAVDSTDWVSYNPSAPKLSFSGKTVAGPLYADSAKTQLKVTRNTDEKVSALFLHLHNATGDLSGKTPDADGAKAQVVDFK